MSETIELIRPGIRYWHRKGVIGSGVILIVSIIGVVISFEQFGLEQKLVGTAWLVLFTWFFGFLIRTSWRTWIELTPDAIQGQKNDIAFSFHWDDIQAVSHLYEQGQPVIHLHSETRSMNLPDISQAQRVLGLLHQRLPGPVFTQQALLSIERLSAFRVVDDLVSSTDEPIRIPRKVSRRVHVLVWLAILIVSLAISYLNQGWTAAAVVAGLVGLWIYLTSAIFQRFEATRQALTLLTWRGRVVLPWESLNRVYRSPSGNKLVLMGSEAQIMIPPDVRMQSWHAFMWLVMGKIEASGLEIEATPRIHLWRTRRL